MLLNLLRRILPRRIKRFLKRYRDPNLSLTAGERRVLARRRAVPVRFIPREGAAPVVCLSIFDFEYRRQRPQHFAAGLAARGHRVYWVSRTTTALRGSVVTRSAEGGVDEVLLPLRQPVVDAVDPFDSRLVQRAVEALAALGERHGLRDAVLLVQMPAWGPIAIEARRRLGWPIVYDCMDDWSNFPGISPLVLEAERALAASADHLVVSSERLAGRWPERPTPPVLIRNAADVSHFGVPDAIDLLPGVAPVIGYVGAIAEWFHAEAVAAAAAAHPEWTFALAGRIDAPVLPILNLPNVRLLGEKPYEIAPAWVARFDVCLVPFRSGAFSDAIDPIKLYEYFAAGKPVVSSPFAGVLRWRDEIEIAEQPAEWAPAIERALSDRGPDRTGRRIAIAGENDWSRRIDDLERLIAR